MFMQNKRKKIIDVLIILTFLILSIISVCILAHTHVLYDAADMRFHIKRIAELKASISHGDILPMFSLNYFHGSAVMGMYPYISIFPFIIFLYFTHSLVSSYYIFASFIIFCSLMISFFSSIEFSRSRKISYLFSIIYSISTSYIYIFFNNGDLGAVTSCAFIPLVIFGFLDVIYNHDNYVKLSLGITFMLFCQIPSTAVMILFLLMWLVININKITFNDFKKLLKASLLTVLLTNIIWIPILKIIYINHIHTVSQMTIVGCNIKQFMGNLSIISLIVAIISLLFISKFDRVYKQMLFLSIIVIIASTKVMPWRFITRIFPLNFINQFQLAYRFLIIPQVLLSYLGAFLIIKELKHINIFGILSVSILIIIIQLLFQCVILVHHENTTNFLTSYEDSSILKTGKYRHKSLSHYMIRNSRESNYLINGYIELSDYYPKNSMKKQNYIRRGLGLYDRRRVIKFYHDGYNSFKFHNNVVVHRLSLPFVYYKGEHLKMYLNNHQIHFSSNRNDMITLNNINPGNNNLKIKYIPDVQMLTYEMLLLIIGISWIFNKYRLEYKE